MPGIHTPTLRNYPLTLLVVFLPVFLAACSNGGGENAWQNQSNGTPVVEAVQVMFGSLPLEERLSGSVRARNQTDIFTETSGTIGEVFVDDGDSVAAGDPLVQLRARDFEERVRQARAGLEVAEARVRQAEANLVRMQANFERVTAIVERGLGTQAELDTARADAVSAEADLDLMLAQRDQAASVVQERMAELADTLIVAPIDGVIGSRNAEVGQQATTSTPLFTIGDLGSMQVEIILTQEMLRYISNDTPVNIYTDSAPDEQVQASISRISPYLHPVTHTTRAEIHVEEHQGILRPGMFVTVDVLYGQSQQAPLVPNSAIYRHPRNGVEGVFIANLDDVPGDPENTGFSRFNPAMFKTPLGPVPVSFVAVDVIARGRMSSGVAGIEQGDWVVTMGHHLLTNEQGQQAIVQPTPWDHILELQQMQSQDLLEIIREKQTQDDALTLRSN